MYSTYMTLKNCVILFGFLVFYTGQASSLKCYNCGSFDDEDCYTNPQQPKFEFECPLDGTLHIGVTKDGSKFPIDSITENLLETEESYMAHSSYSSCFKIVSKNSFEAKSRIFRNCKFDLLTCEDYKHWLTGLGATVESCSVCNEDLCNY